MVVLSGRSIAIYLKRSMHAQNCLHYLTIVNYDREDVKTVLIIIITNVA